MIEVYASVITNKKGSGYGAIIRTRQGVKWQELYRVSEFVDTTDTETAIYSCLYRVLDWLIAYNLNREEIMYYTDNPLALIDQSIKNSEVSNVIPKFNRISFENIDRSENVLARKLATYQVTN